MTDIVIVAGARTPVGAFLGAFANVPAHRLGEAAIRAALVEVPAFGGVGADGGGIAIRADGSLGWWHNSPAFVVGIATSDAAEPRIYLHKDEEGRHG